MGNLSKSHNEKVAQSGLNTCSDSSLPSLLFYSSASPLLETWRDVYGVPLSQFKTETTFPPRPPKNPGYKLVHLFLSICY